jgi:AAA+ ATPase superfamily predicted ATPase
LHLATSLLLKKTGYKGTKNLIDRLYWTLTVFPYKSELEMDRIDDVITHYQQSHLHLEAFTYEEICKDWIWAHTLPSFSPQKVGRWWDKHTKIDLVATNERDNHILFGEVKWSKKPVGTNILNDLKEKHQHVIWGKDNRKESFILFSKSGFTDGLSKQARDENVYLVHQDKLLT